MHGYMPINPVVPEKECAFRSIPLPAAKPHRRFALRTLSVSGEPFLGGVTGTSYACHTKCGDIRSPGKSTSA